jgi:outer membrane protein assembly factor BamA
MHITPHLRAYACAVALMISLCAFTQAGLAQEANLNGSVQSATEVIKTTDWTVTPPAPTPTPSPSPVPAQINNLGDRVKNMSRNAPRRENITGINVGVKYVNAILGGFEQGAGFPFGVEFTTADAIPGVELRARLLTSTRFYRKAELGAYFPKIGDDKTHAEAWFAYQRRTRDHFFGLGSRTPKTLQTNADIETRSYNFSLFRDFTEDLQVGGYVRVANAGTYTGDNDKEPPIGTLFTGGNPPNTTPLNLPASFVPGLFTNVKTVGYGGFAEYDARKDEIGLTKGGYAYVRLGKVEGLEIKPQLFSDYSWTEIELDGRAYIPLGSNKTSLALRAYADLRDPSGNSLVPFYDQPWLGGRNHLRGYQNFRFRANNLLLLIGELRQTVWTQKEDRGVDVFVFVDNGKIWGDTRSTTNPAILANDTFGDQPWRVGPGGGFQYRWNKSTAVRFDIGKTNERTMIYFSVSRGF